MPSSWGLSKPLARYQATFAIGRSSDIVRNQGADYFVLALLGVDQVAVFRIANRISGAVFEVIGEPLRQQLWARADVMLGQSATENTGACTAVMARGMAALTPMYLLLILCANDLTAVMLPGKEWGSVAVIVALVSIPRVFAPVVLFTELVFVSRAPARVSAKNAWLWMGLSLGFGGAFAAMNQTAASVALGTAVGAILANVYMVHAHFKYVTWSLAALVKQLAPYGMALAAAGASTGILMHFWHTEPIWRLVCGAGVFVVIYTTMAGPRLLQFRPN